MRKNLIDKIYIMIYMKYCKIRHKRFLKRFTVVYKFKNKIGYFTDAIGMNKKNVISKARVLIYYSGFFDEIKNFRDINKIDIIAIEMED